MTEPSAQPEARRRRRAAETARLCIATRTILPTGAMIRFVAGPDGTVIPDLKRRLPGRGAWVTARRRSVERAIERRAFARALKADVHIPADLVPGLERRLEKSVLDALAIAHRAGLVAVDRPAIQAAVNKGEAVALFAARDAGADGALALLRPEPRSPEPVTIDVFTTDQLDLAVERLNVVHAALLAGRASEAVLAQWRIFERFRTDDGDGLLPPALKP